MNKELKERWIDSLRSGQWPQGFNFLCKDGRYCCLGVLNDIAGVEARNIILRDGSTVLTFADAPNKLGWDFVQNNGTLTETLGLSQHAADRVAEMNDRVESFDTIADWIEENVEAS